MKPVVTLSVLAMVLLPNLAIAQGWHDGQKLDETAASCLPGMIWDVEKSACAGNPTS